MRNLTLNVVILAVSCTASMRSAHAWQNIADSFAYDIEGTLPNDPPPDPDGSSEASSLGATAYAFSNGGSGNHNLRAFARVVDTAPGPGSLASPSTNYPQRNASAVAGYVDDVTITTWDSLAMTAALTIHVNGSLSVSRAGFLRSGGGVSSSITLATRGPDPAACGFG